MWEKTGEWNWVVPKKVISFNEYVKEIFKIKKDLGEDQLM